MKQHRFSIELDRAARPCEVSAACQRGSAWMTQQQDGRDVARRAGQRFVNVTRQLLRRTWIPAVVGLAMASAIPVALDYDSGIPGFGIWLAVVLGLFARHVCEELRG